MNKYSDRLDAGKVLAKKLQSYALNPQVLVLALPRGGVPVAAEIAKSLSASLDILIVRKLGVPGHEELAFGAIAPHNEIVFNQDVLGQLRLSEAEITNVIQSEQRELARRETVYRHNKPYPEFNNKIIILVDDGIATGATMRAAIQAIKSQKPKKLIIAVPVASPETIAEMKNLADEVICPLMPGNFHAVGVWYDDFTQTTDEEVFQLLKSKSGRLG